MCWKIGVRGQRGTVTQLTSAGYGDRLCSRLLLGDVKYAHSDVAPASDVATAVGTGDDALIRRMGRDSDSIAAALAAPKGSVYLRLHRLGHGGASVRVEIGPKYTPRRPGTSRRT